MAKHGGNQGGRTPKINTLRLDKAQSILNTPEKMRAVICTDRELCMLINKDLPEECKLSYTVFKQYKAGKKLEDPMAQELMERFVSLYEEALFIQKEALFDKMLTESLRLKYTWIIERKRKKRNLKSISDNNNKNSGEVKLTIDYSD